MDSVDSALKALKAAITKSKSKDKKRLGEAAGHVQTHLVLLRMNSVSEQVCRQLASFLRDILGTLYVAMPLPALRLAAAIFDYTFHDRILSAIVSARAEQQELWQSVLYALLSGVLDYLDANDTKESKNAVGDALFTVLSDVCFSLSAPKIGVDLRCTAYNILVDASASHQGNQNKLRDPKCLGGERLGSCIWRTKDYLPLEGLLNVFARALPSTNNTASGRTRRTAFIQSVFKNSAPPESLAAGRDIADILENVPTSDWEQTSVKIVDALAQGNITYPQSFAITEVVVGGDALPSDRLYADDKTFLANVLLGDDQYESLEFAYVTIARIHGGRGTDDRVQITLTLLSPPKLGKELVQPKNPRSDLTEGTINTTFNIRAEQVDKFSRVLEVRGLRQLLTGELRASVATKLSIANQPAQLEIDSAGRLVEPTQSERIVNLSQFYRTDDASDDIQSAGDFDEFVAAVEVSSQPIIPPVPVNDGSAFEIADDKSPTPAVDPTLVITGSKISDNVTTNPSKATSSGLTRTTSQMIRTAFGAEGDDLSDISECDTPVPMSRVMRRTSTSTSTLVRGRLSFQQISAQESSGRLSRGRIRNTVLDSDEESPPAPPIGLQRRAKRALARSPTMDDAEEGPSLSLPLVPLVSEAPAPSTPPSQKLQVPSSSLGPNSASAKVLRFSEAEIPAPDFNAAISSPVLPSKAVLKSALAKKVPVRKTSANDVLLDSSPPRALAPATKRSAALKANNIMKDIDLAPASSSPTPAAKKSVKAALCKKGQPAPPKPTQARSPKRKAPTADGEDENLPLVPVENVASRPAKRARTSAADRPLDQEDVKPKTDELDSPAFRPAMRARKKYHAKGRTSSPPAKTLEVDRKIFVDYDALPSPPRPSAAAATVASSSPAPELRAKRNVLQEKVVKEKNVKTEKADKHKGTNKDEAKSKGKSGKGEKTAEAEKTSNAEQKVKSEKEAGKTLKDIGKAAQKAEKKTEMKTVHADEELKALEDKELPSVTTAPRGRPRPRKVGAGAAKEKNPHQEAQVLQEEEEASSTTVAQAPVRSSARVAAATKDDHEKVQQGTEEDVGAPNESDVLEVLQEDVVPEPPLFFDTTSPPESDETVVFKTDAPPKAVTSSSRKTKTPDTATKKNKKSSVTPWDMAAERQALDEQEPAEVVDPDEAVTSDIAYCDPVEVEVDVEDTMVSMCDTTIVHAPSPVSEKLYSPKKHIEAQKSSSPIIKPSPIPVKPVKKVVETIDLTADSPPKAVRRLASPKPAVLPRRRSARLTRSSLPPVMEEEEVEEVDVAAFKEPLRVPEVTSRRPVPTHRTVQFVPEAVSLKHEPAKRSVQTTLPVHKPKQSLAAATRRKQEMLAEIEEDEQKPVYGGDPTMQRIVDVLNDIHEVVVRSIHNRFEGVREDARASRDELLRCAVDDLHAIRAESVTHFNLLVGLEAEYSKVGRDVVHGAEDWMKVNREMCRELAAAVETHDRGMLSKKMPAVLVPLSV